MAPLGRKPGAIHKLVKSSDHQDSGAAPGPRVSEKPELVNSEVDDIKPTAWLSKDELQFAVEARASGMIDHLLEISKLPATDISLDEVKSATEDHDQYVESLGKKASSIQLNLDRCKTLMQSSDNWTKDRIEAKKSKLDALRAAKARLEATACFLSYQGHEARSQANTTSYYRATPTSKNSKELLRDIHLALSNWFLSTAIADDHFFGKLLDKLQALGLEIKVTDDGKTLVKSARYYSNLEVMLSVVSCKRTLNRILKETSAKHADSHEVSNSQVQASKAELQALLEETNSLWEEVVPVAHMAVEKTMLEPILKLANTKMEAQNYQNAIIGSYIGNCLSYMNDRLEALSKRLSAAIHHHHALLNTFECHQALHSPKTSEPSKRPESTLTNDQARPSNESLVALKQVSRGLELNGGIPARSFDFAHPATKRAALLNDIMAQRLMKDDDRLRVLEHNFETIIKGSLREGSSINIEVLERLSAESLKGSGEQGAILRDAQTEESLEALEIENKQLNSLLEFLPNRQDTQDYRNDFKGAEIMKRWSEPLGASR
ncbi:hypothetical protein G7054_g11938 [Neopestalotiopsis clavispora]|nr:hypothetical protein G7054_g11938 [Neopestalotiopsis clavispora]